ncbi:lysozyme inhibitor LprI family protein [Oricola sp.]|uniref:lysozyme inhibitor LprI family protein n=1 Tax=Oricola sp. TaxID=1979950 RepID=UPI003BA96892
MSARLRMAMARTARTLVATAVVLPATVFTATAQDWDCTNAGDLPQQGMNWCAAMDYQSADRALNVLWPKVRQHMKDMDADLADLGPDLVGAEDALLKAQRAWIEYRDGHCASEGFAARGGSLEPLLVSSCKAHMTKERTQELLLLMETY